MSHESLDVVEQSIIGALLDPQQRVIDDLDLDPADFNDIRCEATYRVIQSMQAEGKTADPATVDAEIRQDPTFDIKGVDFEWLYDAFKANTTFFSVDEYARIVRDAAVKRRIRTAATRIAQAVAEDLAVEDLVDLARREVDQAGQVNAVDLQTLGESMRATLDSMGKPVERVLSPWGDLNSLIGGFSPGRLYVVGARPSVGKSVVALQCALALAKEGFVSFSSLEMSKNEINQRIIAHDLQIPMDKVLDGRLCQDEWDRVHQHMATWSRSKLIVNDDAAVSFANLRQHARSVARRGKLSGIVVDYLQLMTAARGDSRKRHEVVADFSRNLKILARDLHVPVIALSQLNRESTSREDKSPRISDLRESGAVEQDADVVILLHRELVGPASTEMKMLVAKNRQGRTGPLTLDFFGHYSEARSIR